MVLTNRLVTSLFDQRCIVSVKWVTKVFLKLLKFMKGAGEVGQQYNTSDTPKLQTNNAIREDN